MIMLFSVAVVGIVTLFFCLVWMKKHKPLTLPGPKGLPFVGNLLQLDNKSLNRMGQTIWWSVFYQSDGRQLGGGVQL